MNIRACVLGLITIAAAFPVGAQDLIGLGTTITLATQAQKAFESGQYVFLAVVGLMIFLQVLKLFLGRMGVKSVRKNAAQYSAGIGGVVGGVGSFISGSDPVSGSIGGMLAGNAASGLYSSMVKPFFTWVLPKVFGGAFWYLPVMALVGVGSYFGLMKLIRQSPKEKRRKILSEFDEAMEKVKDKNNPSTLELEAWITKTLD